MIGDFYLGVNSAAHGGVVGRGTAKAAPRLFQPLERSGGGFQRMDGRVVELLDLERLEALAQSVLRA